MTTSALSITEWVPISTLGHVSPGLRFHPGRSVFPRPVGGLSFSRKAFPVSRRLKRRLAFTPAAAGLPYTRHAPDSTPLPGSMSRDASVDTCPPSPRAPSPSPGVTRGRVMSLITSPGVTPASSLLRAHAPDRSPSPRLCELLLPRVFAGGCRPRLDVDPSRPYLCESFPECLAPYPGGSLGALLVSSLGTSAFPTLGTGRLSQQCPALGDFDAELDFEAAGIF